MPHHHRRSHATGILASLLSVGLLAAACAGDDDEQISDTTESTANQDPESATTSGDSTTTSSESTTTTVETRGDAQWVDVARSLFERNFALLNDPDPDRLTDLYAETCPCLGPQKDTVEFLASRNEHVEGQAASVLFVRHEGTEQTTGLVELTIEIQANALRRVSADGAVVEEFPEDDSSSCLAFSVRPDGPRGAYRIYSETSLAATACSGGA